MQPLATTPPVLTTTASQAHSKKRFGTVAILAAQWAVLVACVLYMGGRALPRAWLHLNTDFPNYYVTARLLREGYSTRRAYEWTWLQRQKDHMGIARADQPVVGFVPHTPFSALLMWPLTYWPPLAAKRIWIAFNLLLLVAAAVLLKSLTGLLWRQLALVIGLCYPLMRNLQYGQYYILLLFLIAAALCVYVRGGRFTSGMLLGIACGLKIFPGFFLLYFARKRDARAAFGLIIGALATVAASLWAFGLELHRTYLAQVLPWALRGDAMNPYSLGLPSLSALLHKLFLFEPDWNPHPLVKAPVAFAVLLPLLQMAVLAPAIYLSVPKNRSAERIQLEWSTFIVALLAISTLPASYHFTLLILPVVVLSALFLREKDWSRLTLLAVLYLAIGFPAWPKVGDSGWWSLLGVPRLYFVLTLCVLCYATLLRQMEDRERRFDRAIWAAVLAIAVVTQSALTLHYQHSILNGVAGSRIAMPPSVLLATEPVIANSLSFIAMRSDGYTAISSDPAGLHAAEADQLSMAAYGDTLWIEQAGTTSQIVRQTADQRVRPVEVNDAEFPVVSPDGHWLAYLHSNRGRAALWLRSLTDPQIPAVRMSPSPFDVEEMSFLPEGSLVFSGGKNEQASALYVAHLSGDIQELNIDDARYPAASPDGRWLAYSQLDHGVWKLRLRDLRDGSDRRITDNSCNSISPAWTKDSKTLIYASDCGRALWFTALYRLRVLP